ncbi:hypothetical protein BDV19DRAFT_353475 [Aspergillus venezuelensis]
MSERMSLSLCYCKKACSFCQPLRDSDRTPNCRMKSRWIPAAPALSSTNLASSEGDNIIRTLMELPFPCRRNRPRLSGRHPSITPCQDSSLRMFSEKEQLAVSSNSTLKRRLDLLDPSSSFAGYCSSSTSLIFNDDSMLIFTPLTYSRGRQLHPSFYGVSPHRYTGSGGLWSLQRASFSMGLLTGICRSRCLLSSVWSRFTRSYGRGSHFRYL